MSRFIICGLAVVCALFCVSSVAQTEKKPAPAKKTIDPFRKADDVKKTDEKAPNTFQDLLDKKVEVPKKQSVPITTGPKVGSKTAVSRPGAARPASTSTNPFGDDSESPFGSFSSDSDDANPFGNSTTQWSSDDATVPFTPSSGANPFGQVDDDQASNNPFGQQTMPTPGIGAPSATGDFGSVGQIGMQSAETMFDQSVASALALLFKK